MNALREIALLESRDVLIKRFKEAHGRIPKEENCRQIAAYLLQGRQYWDSALSAGDLIRPLLLYYGSLSFCRALTLFARPGGGEETLKPSHGMQAIGWGQAFAIGGVKSILDFEVEVSEGALSQLAEATQNQEITRCYFGPFPSYVEFIRPCKADGMLGSRATIRDLIKRVPQLSATYERVTGTRSAAYPAIPFLLAETHVDLEIFLTEKGPKYWDTLRADLAVPDDIPIDEGRVSRFGNGKQSAWMRIPWDRASWLCPQLAKDSSGHLWAISSICNGQNWNQLTILLMISYAIGMLVRYHPLVWVKMSGQLRGDLVFPLLREARIAIEENLPELVVDQFDLLASRASTV